MTKWGRSGEGGVENGAEPVREVSEMGRHSWPLGRTAVQHGCDSGAREMALLNDGYEIRRKTWR